MALHFIAGLPRAGSTLLGAILRQNPQVRAGMSSPLAGMVRGLLAEMSQKNEFALFLSDQQRREILRGVFTGYHGDALMTGTVFDTNRDWPARLDAVVELFPSARMILCVRDLGWIADSIERAVRANKFQLSRIFNFDPNGSVYSRVNGVMGAGGMVGNAYDLIREALAGPHAARLMFLTYETLTAEPARALREVYGFIGEPPFEHDFDNVAFSADEFDARLGTPGLHTVRAQVEAIRRETILPPDLFGKFASDAFWKDLATSRRGAKVL